jgi:competence protein ComEC
VVDPAALFVAADFVLGVTALAVLRPRRGRAATIFWLALISLIGALAGQLAGGARVSAIDAGALQARSGTEASIRGVVAAVPRRTRGEVSVRVDSPNGRVLVIASEPVPELAIGAAVSARGVLVTPEPWRADELRRRGIAMALRTDEVTLEQGSRRGILGWIDAIRGRAERALSRGMPERESALARGFVLGEDDRIDPEVRDDFKRSGLAHLLAVSGQNVLLLCLLAWPLLALLGITLRARLVALLLVVAIYVPVTGAGPSIQRAGVMGAAGLIAALAESPRSRWYALLLAAATTLAFNPRVSGDVGWQLSFAAVIGILLWSGRLSNLLGATAARGSPRRALAEGAAVTIAATVATAPLMAHHFEALSVASLPANLLALPAVAPAMWLGMLAGILGQIPPIPVQPLNWIDSLCLAYIAQIAHWLAAPDWALLELQLATPLAVAGAYAGLICTAELALLWARRRQGLGFRGALATPAKAGAILALALVAWLALLRPHGEPAPAAADLVVRVLDVGQGDAILLDPPDGEPVLVDTGPPGSGIAGRLRELGVESLAAVVITHDQSDHAGGLGELLESVAARRVVYGEADPRLRRAALAEGSRPLRLAEGGELASGGLRLTALWPPPELTAGPSEDPNRLSLVLVGDWRHFSILLTGDAEAELTHVDPGPVDVLKVAHHGSDDAGLGALLEHCVPKMAVISVGAGNPYGHPTAKTLATLREHRVPTLRTDRAGEVMIEADAASWRVGAG